MTTEKRLWHPMKRLALEIAQKELEWQFEKHGFCYIGFVVDAETWEKHNIGDTYRGGLVMEGTGDGHSGINNQVLVVRYGGPEREPEIPARRWQDRKDCGFD